MRLNSRTEGMQPLMVSTQPQQPASPLGFSRVAVLAVGAYFIIAPSMTLLIKQILSSW